MPLVSTRALVLHAFAYGDTSKIVRLLTPEHGLRSVIAKGARGARSRFGGGLEPFTEGEAIFHLRENRDLFILSGFSVNRSRQAIGRDLAAFSSASLVAELTLRFTTEEPHPALYDFVNVSFERLADPATRGVPAGLEAVWALISLLGFQPETSSCVVCARTFGASETVGFDVPAGGSVCRDCRPGGRGLEPGVRLALLAMTSGHESVIEPRTLPTHAALLEVFVSTHLAADRPLRSLPLFLETLRSPPPPA